jgi:hypothetical protein
MSDRQSLPREKNALLATSRDRNAPCRSNAANRSGDVVRQKYVS